MFLVDYFELTNPLISIITGLSFFVIFNYLVSQVNRLVRLPNGPWGYPIVGYLPFIKDDIYLVFDRLAKKYGPVFSLKLGKHDTVVICDWEHLKVAFADEALLARPHENFYAGLIDESSFIEMSGDPWREHRRLSIQILRDVGFGKSTMETLITREIDQFLPTIEGEKIDFTKKITPSVSNIISCFLFGQNFEYSDPYKIELDEQMEKLGQVFEFTGIQAFLPWLTRILSYFKVANLEQIKRAINDSDNLVQEKIDERMKSYSPSTEIVDYIDGYLQEKEKRKAKGDHIFNFKILKRNVTEFFGAGSETVATTLSWTMNYLVHFPEYQEKIRSEISEITGYDRKPNYTDRNQMPFTMAFLYETQRIGSVIASNLLRRASRDTKIGQYTIPKDTLVIFNLWSIHREEKLWPDPERFDPNRFLTDNGTKAFKPPYLVPFGAGKRNCLGEGLANVELFLYIVSILQRYRIKSEKIDHNLCSESIYAAARRPKCLPPLTFERL
ncbi:cytochrome P450 2C15-like [Panonychus citri]|uniref:cytochrome P450 2C15-like n=1 Tax=Panonychus citri TaxID=50023 RepID=UPI002307B654|nr:cytochrome P450 2C15-like [Panonychus citri]